jgi:hypothetical protein
VILVTKYASFCVSAIGGTLWTADKRLKKAALDFCIGPNDSYATFGPIPPAGFSKKWPVGFRDTKSLHNTEKRSLS